MDPVVPADADAGNNVTDKEMMVPAQPLHIQTTAVTTTLPPLPSADSVCIPTNAIAPGPSMTLSQLPIRPSTVQLLTQRGFDTTFDVSDSLRFGLSNLAAELNRPNDLTTVAGIVREINGCIHYAWTGSFVARGRSISNNYNSFGTEEITGRHLDTNHRPSVDSSRLSATAATATTTPPATSKNSSPNIMTATELVYPESASNLNSISVNGMGQHSGECRPRKQNHIVTFCKEVDKLLGGGIHLGEVTEIAGLPGCGKTQLAMQLSVMARLPDAFGGVHGQTLYIDSEGSFTPERVWDMAEGLQIHIQSSIDRSRKRSKTHQTSNGTGNDAESTAGGNSRSKKTKSRQRDSGGSVVDIARERQAESFTVEEVLRSIQVFRVHDETALTTTIYSLPEYIDHIESCEQSTTTNGEQNDDQYQHCTPQSLPVRLVVIDSIAFQFRAVAPTDPSYYIQRTKALTNLASFLADLASDYNIAVVVINQMTTKIISSGSSFNGTSKRGEISGLNTAAALVPALGESWAHSTATRLILSIPNAPNDSGIVSNDDQQLLSGEDEHREIRSNSSVQTSKQIRVCELVKSAYRPSGSAEFVIVAEGIRGTDKSIGGATSSLRRQEVNVVHGGRGNGGGNQDSSLVPGRPPRQRDTNLTEVNASHSGKRSRDD